MEGWLKIHRKILENTIVCKDSDHLSIWIYLLLNATHKDIPALFRGHKITLEPGQLITGRKSIAKQLNISESKVKRTLIELESDQQIVRQRSNQNSLISIVNWNKYQAHDQQNGQPVDSQWTASDHKQECKNVRNNLFILNNKEKDFVGFQEGDEVSEYLKTKGIKNIDEYKRLDRNKQDELIEEWFIETR